MTEHDDERLEPELEDYSDPLDAWPASLREPAKMYRAIALLYVFTTNADRLGAWLSATAKNVRELIELAEREAADAETRE